MKQTVNGHELAHTVVKTLYRHAKEGVDLIQKIDAVTQSESRAAVIWAATYFATTGIEAVAKETVEELEKRGITVTYSAADIAHVLGLLSMALSGGEETLDAHGLTEEQYRR